MDVRWTNAWLVGIALAGCGDGGMTGGSEPSTTAVTSMASSGDSSPSTSQAGSDGESSEGTMADPCQPAPDPELEIGLGEGTYASFDSGRAELIHGVQGGFHILIGARARFIDASDTAVMRLTGTIEGEQLASTAPYADFVCNDGALEAVNLLLIWDSTPELLHGKMANIDAELTDTSGTVVIASGDVEIFDPALE